MTASSWVDLPAGSGGLLVVAIVAVFCAAVWIVERYLDVRDNRRALRRRQILRHAPPPNENRRGVAAPTAVTDLGADYPAFDNIHGNGRARERSS